MNQQPSTSPSLAAGAVLVILVLGLAGWGVWQLVRPETPGERYDRLLHQRRETEARLEAREDARRRAAVTAARAAILSMLKDPESAQFVGEQVRAAGDGYAVCGQVNARTGFGGYTGPRRYVAHRGAVVFEEAATPAQMADAWSRFCR